MEGKKDERWSLNNIKEPYYQSEVDLTEKEESPFDDLKEEGWQSGETNTKLTEGYKQWEQENNLKSNCKLTFTDIKEETSFWKEKELNKRIQIKESPSVTSTCQSSPNWISGLNDVSQKLNKDKLKSYSLNIDRAKSIQCDFESNVNKIQHISSKKSKHKHNLPLPRKRTKNSRIFHTNFGNEKTPFNLEMRCQNCLSTNHAKDVECPLIQVMKNIETKIKRSVYSSINVQKEESFFSKYRSMKDGEQKEE